MSNVRRPQYFVARVRDMPLGHLYSPSPHAPCHVGCPSVGGQRTAWSSRPDSQAARRVGCPSFGGQRASGCSPRVKHRWFQWWQQSLRGNTVAVMLRAQEPQQVFKQRLRLGGHGNLGVRGRSAPSLAVAGRSPNPSVKRTSNGGPRSAGFTTAVPPLASAYLQR